MTDPRRPPDDGLEAALRAMTSADASPGPDCLDANLLAAFATGQILDEERAGAESHLAACAACRSAVAVALRDAPSDAVAPSARPRSTPLRPLVVAGLAALLLLAIGLARWDRSSSRPAGTDAELRVAWASLAASRPDLFAEVEPLAAAERRMRGAALQRGGLWIEAPGGLVLETRPTFRWSGRGSATVRVSTVAGHEVGSAGNVASPWTWPESADPLARGEGYLVELEAEGLLGPERASRTFRTAADAQVSRYEQGVQAIRSLVRRPLQALVLAHFALRADLLAEARRFAEDYATARPDDPVGRETLFQVLTRQGVPDVDHLLEAAK